MEKNIKIHIKDRVAVAEGDPVIVCGNGDYTVTFSFDEEWGQAFTKTARFKFNTAEGPAHIDQPFTGDTVEVPELSDIREVEVGVFVGDLNTTTGASIRCRPCIRCGGGAPKDPTPDVYDEIMELIKKSGSKIEEQSIEGKHIVDDSIDGYHIQNNSIGDGHILEGAILESKIFKDAVTTEKIKDKNVTPEKLDRKYATPEYVDEKTTLVKTERTNINLFDNNVGSANGFKQDGHINYKDGVEVDTDNSKKLFHRTGLISVGEPTNTLRLRSTEASDSLMILLYDSEEKFLDSASCNKETVKNVDLNKQFKYFRLYTYKTSTAKILVTTEEVPAELTQEELLELIEGKEVVTYVNEDFKNLVDEVGALKADAASVSAEKENRLARVKECADKLENIRDFEKSYRVGADKEYTTIDGALKQWEADGHPKATVYISNGEYIADEENYSGSDGYKAVIFVDTSATTPKTISFIGESREGVILRTKKGNYENAPVMVRHGNVEIKNMTIIADHSATPDFDYPTKPDGVTRRTQAYALHIDGGNNATFGEAGARVLVENVTAISHQSPAFGMGTIPNSTIRLVNCKAISYTESEENIYNAGLANSYGAILCHKSAPDTYADRGSEKLELINVEAYAKNNDKPLCLVGAKAESYNLLALDTVLASGATANGEGYLNDDKVEILILDDLSSGNTCEALNFKK